MKGLIAWFARNHVVANLLLVVILGAGAVTLIDLKQEIFPEFSLDTITITVNYRGAAPEEVEQSICVRIEEAIQGLDGIKTLKSTAAEGVASIIVEIHSDYDVNRVLDRIKASVDAIETFPEQAEAPVIEEVTTRFHVINVAVSGHTDLATLKRVGEQVRDDLTALPEISQAELVNVPPYEISIEVSEEALREWGLTFDEIANAVRRFSVDVAGGSVKTKSGEILLRTDGQAYTGAEYGSLTLLTRPDGTRIQLRDVARVVDGFEDRDKSALLDGTPAVVVQIYRVGDQNAVEVAEAVHEYVATSAARMPEGIEVATWQDMARELKSRISLLVKTGLTGLLLVFVVLALFMRPRLAFWVSLGIPVSFLGAIALMPVFDVSINMMSLFSFILVLGIVVDDAIVVGEHIYTIQTRRQKGISAAIQGTYEMLVPVVFGVLTTMMAFAPMLFVDGIMGKIMGVFPLIVLPTLFFSLVESNLILPCHLSRYRKPPERPSPHLALRLWNGFFDAFANGLDFVIRRMYRPLLAVALEWRYATLAISLACLLVTAGMIQGGFVRLVLFPTVESDAVVAFVTMPRDAPVEATREAVRQVERSAVELRREIAEEHGGADQVRLILASLGEHPFKILQSGPLAGGAQFSGEHLGEVNMQLLQAELRTASAATIAQRWREKLGQIPGVSELSITHDMIGAGKPIDIQISGPDLADVREAADLTKAKLAEYPGVIDIADTQPGGKPEINVALTPEGEALGVTLRDLGRQVRQGFFGEEAQRIQRGRDDIRVMVRYPEQARRSLADLEQMRVRTPAGAEIPFSTVATASMRRAPASITRVDRQRAINVQAEVEATLTTGGEVLAALDAGFLPELVDRFPGISYTFEGDQADYAESMQSLFRGFGAAMFVMFAMLAIPLKSYLKPILILSAVPLGFVGAVWGHALLGLPLSFLSMCGMVALAGVVVNDGLVLVTFIHSSKTLHGSGMKAVQHAGEARFRAILLTSLTTTAGVTPLLLEKSLQAQFLIPMAVALASGVLFATAVTLVMVPALYLIFEDIRMAFRWMVSGQREPEYELGPASAPSPESAPGD